MEGGGEMIKTPQISQCGSAVTLRSKKICLGRLLGLHQMAAEMPLDQEIAAISKQNLNYSLINRGDGMKAKKEAVISQSLSSERRN